MWEGAIRADLADWGRLVRMGVSGFSCGAVLGLVSKSIPHPRFSWDHASKTAPGTLGEFPSAEKSGRSGCEGRLRDSWRNRVCLSSRSLTCSFLGPGGSMACACASISSCRIALRPVVFEVGRRYAGVYESSTVTSPTTSPTASPTASSTATPTSWPTTSSSSSSNVRALTLAACCFRVTEPSLSPLVNGVGMGAGGSGWRRWAAAAAAGSTRLVLIPKFRDL